MSLERAPYLSRLFHPKTPDLPDWADFFAAVDDRLQTENRTGFAEFLDSQGLSYSQRNDLTARLNERLFSIELAIRQAHALTDFSSPQTLERLFNLTRKYLTPFTGLFLKPSAARRLLIENPMPSLAADIGRAAYAELLERDPLFLLAIGRYAEAGEWNRRHLKLLASLTPDDFERRATACLAVPHSRFPKAAQAIIERKCFNTHDKLVGAHLIATLPPSFDLNGKAPALRTITKIMHYQREMELFSGAFQILAERFPKLLGPQIASFLQGHQYDEASAFFNAHDVLEGEANRYIDRRLAQMAQDFPELKPWARAHSLGQWEEGSFVSLSLWRLTSWFLYGHREHSLKMHRDAVLTRLLAEKYGEQAVEAGIIDSLLDGGGDTLASIKRREYAGSFDAAFKGKTYTEAVLLHHIDADGLTGGHIALRALEKKGARVHCYPMEMFFVDRINAIARKHPGLPLFIVDLGTELAPRLSIPPETPEVFILDHHRPATEALPPRVRAFNPRLNGLAARMEEGCSAINAFYFSRAYLGSPDNAFSALSGAVGDGMLKRNGTFMGLDWLPYAYAVEGGRVEPARNGRLALNYRGETIDAGEFVERCLNPAGSVGFQGEGVKLAFDFLDQAAPLDDARLEALQALKREKYDEAISFLKGGHLTDRGSFVAFNLGGLLDPMSLKEIGNFLEALLREPQAAGLPPLSGKYLFGAQRVPGTSQIKISMRAGSDLSAEIRNGQKPSFLEITRCFRNEPGGIHPLSAAVLAEESEFDAALDQISAFIGNRG